MLVQYKQVVDVELAAKALAEKRIKPPEERPAVDAARCLGWVTPKFWTQEAAFAVSFEHESESLNHNSGGGDVGNGVIRMVCGTEP